MDKKNADTFLGQKLLLHTVEIVFPLSLYLFHCSIQNNAIGDKTTFAFAVTHHQNLSQE